MDNCDICDFDWEAGPDELYRQLKTMGPRFRVDFAAASSASSNTDTASGGTTSSNTASRGPASGDAASGDGWTAAQYLAHVRDVTDFFIERIERVVRLDRPTMPSVDFRGMARRDGYGHDVDLATIETSIDNAAELIRNLDEEQWARVGIGSGGERTVLLLARRLTHEVHHHYQDLSS